MVSWLSVELSKLECASLTTLLNPRDSWVIDDDKQQPLLTAIHNILLMLIMVDSKSISKRVRSKHKRTRAPITIVKNKNLGVEDCFLIVDHVVEKDKFSSDGGGVNENFYKVLSKSGLTATIGPTTNQSLLSRQTESVRDHKFHSGYVIHRWLITDRGHFISHLHQTQE